MKRPIPPPIWDFPPVESADEDGLLGVGGDLEVATLLNAYQKGIFPWPFDSKTLAWFSPPMRAVIWQKDFPLHRSFQKFLKKSPFTVRMNTAFEEVVHQCREVPRPGQRGTWITQGIESAYIALHERGFAHSVEVFQGDRLVGGVYGVSIGGFFGGESMFYIEPNASKVALYSLLSHLKEQNVMWLDCQVINPFLATLGAVELPRSEFLELLRKALKAPALNFPLAR